MVSRILDFQHLIQTAGSCMGQADLALVVPEISSEPLTAIIRFEGLCGKHFSSNNFSE